MDNGFAIIHDHDNSVIVRPELWCVVFESVVFEVIVVPSLNTLNILKIDIIRTVLNQAIVDL